GNWCARGAVAAGGARTVLSDAVPDRGGTFPVPDPVGGPGPDLPQGPPHGARLGERDDGGAADVGFIASEGENGPAGTRPYRQSNRRSCRIPEAARRLDSGRSGRRSRWGTTLSKNRLRGLLLHLRVQYPDSQVPQQDLRVSKLAEAVADAENVLRQGVTWLDV